ncbi:MAG: ABC transporter permease [Dehalococcoidia bacterium]|nr:ABC transporter permease [Dehalococcoidia bacterium]
MTQMLTLTLRQLTGKWRVILIVLLALIPVGLAFVPGGDSADADEEFINGLLDGLLVGVIMPLVTMALATAAFGNEIEDKTLSYVFLKPVARWRIAIPKFLASVIIAAPLALVSGALATYIGTDGDLQTTVAVAIALSVGVITYASVFTWSGLITTRALPFAIVYVFLWEGLLSTFIGGIRYLSVRGYTLAIMNGLDDNGLEVLSDRVIEFPAAVVGAFAVTIVFLWLTVYRLRRMDVP